MALYPEPRSAIIPALRLAQDEYGWLSTEALIKGFQVAGKCPTRANFIKKLRAVKGFDAGGLVQPVDFKTAFGKPILCLYYVEMVGDHWEPRFDGKVVCGKQLT